jgi:hypothetical protein
MQIYMFLSLCLICVNEVFNVQFLLSGPYGSRGVRGCESDRSHDIPHWVWSPTEVEFVWFAEWCGMLPSSSKLMDTTGTSGAWNCGALFNTLRTGSTNLSFHGSAVVDRRDKFVVLSHVRFESMIHWNVAPQLGGSSWVTSLSCLFMDIRYVTSFLTCLSLKKGLWSPTRPSFL